MSESNAPTSSTSKRRGALASIPLMAPQPHWPSSKTTPNIATSKGFIFSRRSSSRAGCLNTSAPARVNGADEGTVRSGIAILLAVLIEGGSALGFTLVSVATARNPPPPSTPPRHATQPANAPSRRVHARRSATTNAVQRRVETQHKEDRAAGDRARERCGL